MVHTSNALITATLALSAAAPILAAPVEPRINSGFSSVNIHAPIPPPTQSPATEPVAVPAPAPALEAAAELEARGAMTGAAVGGVIGGGSFSVINSPIQHRLSSRVGPKPQPVPSVEAPTTDGPTAGPQPETASSVSKLSSKLPKPPKGLGLGIALTAGVAATLILPNVLGNKQRDVDADTRHLLGRDVDADVLRLLLDRDLEDIFARSFGIDELSDVRGLAQSRKPGQAEPV